MPGPAAVGYSKNGAVRGGDGRLWFVTTQGLVTIDPARIPRNDVAPPVRIVAIAHNGVRLRDPASIELPAGTPGLQLDYTALSLTLPERVRFRYRLAGADLDWVDAGTRRQAFYTNLAPGTYRFQVIASNNDGVWNEEGASLDITIPPTFLQSVWFKLLLGLMALLFLGLVYLLRVRQVLGRVRSRFEVRIAERERIARELHDTLLQGMQALLLHVRVAANTIPEETGARQPLEQALVHVQGVLVEGRDRVRDLRSGDAATDLSEALAALAATLAVGSGKESRLTVEGTPRDLNPMVREELHRIAEEAIRNTVHHSGATTIDIVLDWHRRGLRMAVRDDGVGIPSPVLERGERPGHFGLTGMHERANRIAGRLTIAGAPGRGTEVSIMVPARTAYREGTIRMKDRLMRRLARWRRDGGK
jgi:signal transduction histidine kinase